MLSDGRSSGPESIGTFENHSEWNERYIATVQIVWNHEHIRNTTMRVVLYAECVFYSGSRKFVTCITF